MFPRPAGLASPAKLATTDFRKNTPAGARSVVVLTARKTWKETGGGNRV
jgi:hypothetical protein